MCSPRPPAAAALHRSTAVPGPRPPYKRPGRRRPHRPGHAAEPGVPPARATAPQDPVPHRSAARPGAAAPRPRRPREPRAAGPALARGGTRSRAGPGRSSGAGAAARSVGLALALAWCRSGVVSLCGDHPAGSCWALEVGGALQDEESAHGLQTRAAGAAGAGVPQAAVHGGHREGGPGCNSASHRDPGQSVVPEPEDQVEEAEHGAEGSKAVPVRGDPACERRLHRQQGPRGGPRGRGALNSPGDWAGFWCLGTCLGCFGPSETDLRAGATGLNCSWLEGTGTPTNFFGCCSVAKCCDSWGFNT